MAYNVPNEIIVISSADINLLATGNTIIFTPKTPFVIVAINTYGVSLTGIIGSPLANFGWTAAAYSDITSGFGQFSTATNNVNGISIQGTIGETQPVPAATAFRINVTVADATATTNTQRIDVLGYYL